MQSGNEATAVDFLRTARAVAESNNLCVLLLQPHAEEQPLRVEDERAESCLTVAVITHQDRHLSAWGQYIATVPEQLLVAVEEVR